MKKHIPNIITAGNAFMGTLGITFVFENKPNYVIICILLALTFDFMDGLVARALKVSSEIGKQLDSLADMVTFGVLPGIMMYQVIQNLTCQEGQCSIFPPFMTTYLPLVGFLITVLSAFRLAKFNVSSDQETNFRGIPTPITALFIAGIYYNSFEPGMLSFLYCPTRLIVISILAGTLLVSNDLFIAFKFKKGSSLNEKLPELLLVIISITLILVTKWLSAVYIYISYIIISYVKFKVLNNK